MAQVARVRDEQGDSLPGIRERPEMLAMSWSVSPRIEDALTY